MLSFLIGGLEAIFALFALERFSFGSAEVGVVFAYVGVVIFVGQFISAKLLMKFKEPLLIKFGILLNAIGFFGIFFSSNIIILAITLAIMIHGNALAVPSVTSLITKKANAKRGTILGVNTSFQSVGQLMGPIFAGYLYGLMPFYAFIGVSGILLGYLGFFVGFDILKK